ncbi:hypothetical protein RHMOL_Rhmol13G0307100 [Rhododendron molle]|uniref:Uncharacterized protein n=1 Tax=Rhododendron molle TaxID=49168 RepID=A0ACC0LDU3_RHOML|nr:hypothetical protein RHMOL_Rhmol13G0307100 [Rhododendron molle]
MEAASSVLLSSSKPHLLFNSSKPSSSSPFGKCPFLGFLPQSFRPFPPGSLVRATSAAASALSLGEVEKPTDSLSPPSSPSPPTSSSKEFLPKIDKTGRFCSPRAARELALSILYAACLEGSDPVRLFEKRMNFRREPGYRFDSTLLTKYNHMSFGGSPVTVETAEEAEELMHIDDKESAIEAEVLSAPPKLVYSKLILRFTRRLLVAVVEKWNSHVLVIEKVAPDNWKNVPAGRILELSILHLAMSEMTVLGTRHQIVINEAVDMAKRFCDGTAPRIINGCLRTFFNGLEEDGKLLGLQSKRSPLR